MIAIIDYNAGNLKSVEKALHFLGQECVVTRDFHEIEQADKVILPSEGVEGLHILDGAIRRIPDQPGLKIPHIGWNSLNLRNDGRLFVGFEEHPYVYFVHSYYLQAKDEQIVKATTEYSTTIHASVEKDNIFACQFHPEKSGDVGLAILKNFAQLGGKA